MQRILDIPINRFLVRSLDDLTTNFTLVLHLFLLSVIAYSPYFIRFSEDTIGLSKISVFIAAGLFLVGLAHRTVFYVLCMLLVPVNLVHMHMKVHWGDAEFGARIEAYLESPLSEKFDYLHGHTNVWDYALLAAALGFLAYLTVIVFRRHGKIEYLQRTAVAALAIWFAIFLSFRLDYRISRMAPFSFVAGIFSANDRYDLLTSRLDFIEKYPLRDLTCNKKYGKIVIVIGESAISDNMSRFGYMKPTTPFFDRSDPHTFDVLAPSNQTRFSLPMMLTNASPGDFNRFYRDHSLVSMLRACGYHTSWVSNQAPGHADNGFVSSIAGEANEQIYLPDMSWRRRPYDGDVVEELNRRGIFERQNQAIFIQLMGSHKIYQNRYPEGFGFQEIADTVGEYDNSLLYTDAVVADIHEKFNGDDLLFVYFSDHGQLVTNNRSGSGFFPGYKEEFRVPLLIWTDDVAAIDQIKSALGRQKLNMSSFSDLAQYLVGITDRLQVSTSGMVSVLAPEQPVDYQELQTADDL